MEELAILGCFHFEIENLLKMHLLVEELFETFKDMKQSVDTFFYA